MMRMAREIADQESAAPANAFVDRTECLAHLNGSIGLWHGMLVDAVPERFEVEETITANGAAAYNLPALHFMTLGVDSLWGSTRVPLKRVQFQDRTRYDATGDAEGYYLKAATIVLVPKPTSGTYYHQYVTAAPVLVSDSDSVDGVNGWEMWPIYDLAVFMMSKEESDPSAVMIKRDKIEALMKAAAADREAANPMRVVDTRLRRY